MKRSDPKAARANALANVRLSGFQVTPEFTGIINLYWDGKISMLEAFKRQGINIKQIPEEKRVELSQDFHESHS